MAAERAEQRVVQCLREIPAPAAHLIEAELPGWASLVLLKGLLPCGVE